MRLTRWIVYPHGYELGSQAGGPAHVVWGRGWLDIKFKEVPKRGHTGLCPNNLTSF